MRIVIAALLFLIIADKVVYAHCECCLSSTLAEATISGVTTAPNFGLSLQYEYTNMKTIREGSKSISPNSVLDNIAAGWPAMPAEPKSFSVPTRMIMQKYTMLGSYAITKKFQFLVTAPYVINDMNMRMLMRGTMGHQMKMDMKMNTIEGLGDVTLMGLYSLYVDKPDLPTKKITLGLGVKTPTGKNDEKDDSGELVHAMMQPGTGSWDPLFLVNYVHTFQPLIFQTNLFYHMATEGDEGYEFGDKLSLDFIARYQVTNYIIPGLELNGLYADQNTDHDGKYSHPDESLLDNTDNTGITSLSVSPSILIKIPKTGGSIDLKFQRPVYQNAQGTQQVVDWRAMASIVWAF